MGDWAKDGYCARDDVDSELWWTPTRETVALAQHICLNHCPVLAECWLKYIPYGGEVASGVVYTQKGHPVKRQPTPRRRCSECT